MAVGQGTHDSAVGHPGFSAVRRLAAATVVLATLASGVGLLRPDVYRDNALVSAAWLGNDLVTLVVFVPLLVVAIVRCAAGSERWRLTLLGLLLYAFYGYAFYLFGAAFNALFLVYVAITAASGYGLLLGLLSVDAARIARAFSPAVPARGVGGFMIVVAAVLGAFWITTSGAFVFSGTPPAMVQATGHPTNVTGALDLIIVVVLGFVGGLWLRQRRPWGYVIGVIWTVKGALYMLALSYASVAAWLIGPATDLAQLGLWGPIGVGSAVAAFALLRRPKPDD